MQVFLLPVMAVLLFFSCNNNGRSMFKTENSVGFDTIMVAERSYLEEDTTKPYCDIRVEFVYPVNSGKASLDTLQRFFVKSMLGQPYDSLAPAEAVKAYVNNYIENYNYDATTYRESAIDMLEMNTLIPGIDLLESEHFPEDVFYSYYESLSDSIVFNRSGVLAFQVRQSNNKGGSTSYDSYRNYVINLNTGQQVTENEIFNAGYDIALQSLIIASLLDKNNVKTVEELEDLGYFGVLEIVPNKNFLLNDKGIIYTYNKGEYSAYQLDAPQVFIPYSLIRSLLRENSIAYKLAGLQ